MITFDSRMVHGYPLQYYSTHPVDPHHQYPYFAKYDYYSMTDNSEELIMPSSPHSTQSDSDNSMSSTDVTAKSIIYKPALPTNSIKQDIKCAWFQCGLWFETLDLLANHVSKAHASSGPSGLFYCGWEGCTRNNKGFNARYKMLVHVRTHTNEKPHQCCQCEKSFSRAENLKIHSRSHSGEKPYLCPVPGCNKAYSNSSDRFKHTRTHQVEKPYLCKVPGCPKRYTDPSSLRKHVKTYKHFPYDPLKPDATQDTTVDTTKLDIRPHSNSKIEQFLPGDNLIKNSLYHENIINSHSCSCPHSCCLKTCLTEAAELLKFGSLINFAGPNLETVTWNRFLDPSMQDKLKFGLYKDEQMDLDVPLDLTVHRK